MKKTIYLLVMLFGATLVSAQGIDFSGTWKLNRSESKLGDQFSMAPNEIIVIHKINEMDIEKHSSFQGQNFTTKDNLTLDGRECVNVGFMDTEKKSTAVWSDDEKMLTITSKIPMQGETMTIVEVYKMDGKNMVIEVSASSSYGDMSEMMVYNKQ
ncbi:hypothetical protein GM418_03705 [Maribellus comscasis]|uniref:Lipocalin-like domain-containing protein n=1 Tax=Maribellus comscasis TaxID=2681766 RepID=A0A6I6JJ39_9BACT|nr:hypothetical protein [Maribellus comscasis]QGY42786.1 hypothetical protein GM418_03705 [Maribellus comscasis]